MFANILLPLDGSELAQEALPYVEALALPLKAVVHLLMVAPSPSGRTGGAFKAAAAFLTSVQLPRSENDLDIARHPVYKESEMASLEAEAKRMLLPVAEQLKAKGIEAKAEVAFGRPAGGILRYAQSNKIDLIVMSTHGEGGPDPYAYGPTTDRVARRAPCPVMLIRPAEVRELLPLPKMEEIQP
ncbi:MAG TPA: universal stress protein [Anaerolineales bacterium]|nr:universal stress protein [Anaerolineales bacterium]